MNIAGVLQGIAALAWLGAIGALGLVVFTIARGQKAGAVSGVFGVVLVIAVALSATSSGLVFIEPDELGVVVTAVGQGGIRQEVLGAGLHWIIPFFERVERYSILNRTYTMTSTPTEGQVTGDDSIQVRTKDGQQVLVDATVIYAINPARAVSLYTTWRGTFENGLVRPQARGIIRDMASQYGIEEIVSSKRAEMEQKITDELDRIFTANNLILQDFVVRNVRFSDEYAAAVEQKQIAEQLAQQAEFVVEQRKQEAEQARQVAQGQADAAVIAAQGAADARILQAQAEAQALKLISEAIKANPDLLTYRYIEKLSPNVQVMYLPSGQQYLIPVPTPTVPVISPTDPGTTTP